MIFVTVGDQMPFDRLVRAVDIWAGETGHTDIFAQIGMTDYKPQNFIYKHKLSLSEFRNRIKEADAIVAHAGTGTILNALEMGKSILVMPRLGRLMETRNDHQVATAKSFRTLGRVAVAMDELELPAMLNKFQELKNSEVISPYASPELLEAVKGFIQGHE